MDGLAVLAPNRVDDDQLTPDAARLGEEARSVVLLQVPVEVAREDALERSVGERKLQCVASHERRLRDPLGDDLEHPWALVERSDVSSEVPRQKTSAAGDVERPARSKRRDGALQLPHVVVPVAAVESVEAAEPEVPLVVLGRTSVVVRLHDF